MKHVFLAPVRKKGIHILLEKPMSASYASCLRMNEACEKNGVLLQVGHVQPYFPQNRAARALIESGKLGACHDQRSAHQQLFSARPSALVLEKAMAGAAFP